MIKHKKMRTILLIGILFLLFTACSPQKKDKENQTPQTKTEASSHANKKKNKKAKKQAMNLQQIATGDYSSIAGTWHEVAYGMNHLAGHTGTQYILGGHGTIEISDKEITRPGLTIHNNVLTDNNGEHELIYQEEDKALKGKLANQMVAINWGIYFYPKGTTDAYSTDGNSEKNTEDLIIIWTSNNNYTSILSKKVKKTPLSTALNLDELAENNFSSLVGTWKNPTDEDQMIITDQVQNQPEGNTSIVEVGAILADTEKNGYPTIISSGDVQNGYMVGAIGTFDPQIILSPFAPIAIVPKNVKMNDDDDSDANKDRLIIGAGQSGYADSAYYRK